MSATPGPGTEGAELGKWVCVSAMGEAPKGPPDGKEEGHRRWEKGTAMQQRSFSEIR